MKLALFCSNNVLYSDIVKVLDNLLEAHPDTIITSYNPITLRYIRPYTDTRKIKLRAFTADVKTHSLEAPNIRDKEIILASNTVAILDKSPTYKYKAEFITNTAKGFKRPIYHYSYNEEFKIWEPGGIKSTS